VQVKFKIKRFPFYQQMDKADCGPTCIRMIARHHGKVFSAEFLRDKCAITRQGVTFGSISEAAESIGMNTLGVQVNFELLRNNVPLPCIAHWRQRHFLVVYAIKGETVYVADPSCGLIKYTRAEFLQGWLNGRESTDGRGLLLLLEPTPDFYADGIGNVPRSGGIGFLLPYFRPYRPLFMQVVLGLLVASVLQLIFPFLTQAMVDRGIDYQNINFVNLLLLGQLMLFLSQATVNVFRGWLLLHIGSRVNITIVSDFLIKLMRLPIAYFDSKNIGDLLQRVGDNKRIEAFLSASTPAMLPSAVNLIVFGLVLAYYDLWIFGLFIGGTALYVLWVRLFMTQRAILDKKRFNQARGSQSSMIQLMEAIQEIKLNNSERRRRWDWEAIQAELFRIAVKGLSLNQWQTSGASLINEMKNILITYVAARAVINGDMTLGMMLAVQYIVGQLNVPINNFIGFVQSLQDARISLDRLAEVHGHDNEEDPKNKLTVLPASRTLVFDHMSFRYGGQRSPLVLQDLNVEIPEGKVTAIVGASGSGKTTLLKLLLRLYEPTTGTIRIGNVNLENINARVWRSHCGAVMQNGYIFADTIARNITESDSNGLVDRERLLHAVHVANLESCIEARPFGYETRLSAAGVALSGGQSQRLLLARAVYNDPDFLFLDEATSFLDSSNERTIMQNLAAFYQGRTVVVIAHRLSTVRNADQIIVLDHGRVVERGRHEELVRSRGAYFTLVKNQLELGIQ
jgi:ATP-binding cassette subfamily B protein